MWVIKRRVHCTFTLCTCVSRNKSCLIFATTVRQDLQFALGRLLPMLLASSYSSIPSPLSLPSPSSSSSRTGLESTLSCCCRFGSSPRSGHRQTAPRRRRRCVCCAGRARKQLEGRFSLPLPSTVEYAHMTMRVYICSTVHRNRQTTVAH